MLTKRNYYEVEETVLEELFTTYINQQYGYKASVDVVFDTDLYLPIVATIEREDSESFHAFWLKLQEDIQSLHNKHHYDDEAFELGDKLLQLCLNQRTVNYLFDDEQLLVFVDETNELVVDRDKSRAYTKELKEKIDYFQIEENDFEAIGTEDITLDSINIDKIENTVLLIFKHNEQEILTCYLTTTWKDKGYALHVSQHGYCSNTTLFSEVNRMSEKVTRTMQNKLGIADEHLEVFDNIRLIPFEITYYSELTSLESVVLSLKLQGLNYEQIGHFINKSRKGVDNTIQRIYKKELACYDQLKTPSFVLCGPRHTW